MAFDERLAERLRAELAGVRGISERKMFAGLAFLLNGNMCCGIHAGEMIVRLDPQLAQEALRRAHVQAFDLGGRQVKGWVLVRPAGLATEASLARWVQGVSSTLVHCLPKDDAVPPIAGPNANVGIWGAYLRRKAGLRKFGERRHSLGPDEPLPAQRR